MLFLEVQGSMSKPRLCVGSSNQNHHTCPYLREWSKGEAKLKVHFASPLTDSPVAVGSVSLLLERVFISNIASQTSTVQTLDEPLYHSTLWKAPLR